MANTALGDIKVHKKTNKLKRVFLGRGDIVVWRVCFGVGILFSVCSIFCVTSFGDQGHPTIQCL